MTPQEKLHANAELVIKTLGPLSDVPNFGYNRESVAWVEGYIEQQRVRATLTPELADGLVNTLGSFLGECIVQLYGGAWEEEGGAWKVTFAKGDAAYPFNKLRKQIENGVAGGDGILSFFNTIGTLFLSNQPRKSRWRFW